MTQKITLVITLLLTSLSAFSQLDGQWSIEGNYGVGFASRPSLKSDGTINCATRYMFDEFWGVKGDFAFEKFRTDERIPTGVDYFRISAQAVYNIGRALEWPAYTDGYINGLLHAGLGYSHFSSTVTTNDDNMGNIIIGFTPQFQLSERVAIQADASYIVHIRQHFDYDGYYHFPGPPKPFIGGQYNLTFGLVIYLGRTSSDYDWR
ncbi:hypothetical protein GR160_12425 [Flavobacterium sp. Sd200]|uniref:outer membrane beta-barrel protein n=1 Tax=Flavobacterium sp. Sd200 TaxID=2692211 RepID=UPI00136B1DB0|nr:outer membrane beta-barrel protein [Flavobacterium sp. Sd200]MXN92032.1 hypothetical protein [Flavobacterium sp. Sd200]